MRRIGVVTAGGDAPGMNAAIRAIVRTAFYHDIEILGIERGYAGLIEGQVQRLGPRSVSGIINHGGTILKTVRCEEIKSKRGLQQAANTLTDHRIQGLIVIGGDGAFRGASELHRVSGIPIVGVPATIDNDVAGTDTTIGFDTAVNTALDAIDKIRDTATSHERVFVVEVMGRRRGFLALAVGFAAGAEIILIPEIKYDYEDVCHKLEVGRKMGKLSEIIVKAEGAGSSTDVVRRIQDETLYDVRVTVLGHIQRGGSPTAQSRTLANQFGAQAVELLIKGTEQKVVGIREGRLVTLDLDSTWTERKSVDMNMYHLAEVLSSVW